MQEEHLLVVRDLQLAERILALHMISIAVLECSRTFVLTMSMLTISSTLSGRPLLPFTFLTLFTPVRHSSLGGITSTNLMFFFKNLLLIALLPGQRPRRNSILKRKTHISETKHMAKYREQEVSKPFLFFFGPWLQPTICCCSLLNFLASFITLME